MLRYAMVLAAAASTAATPYQIQEEPLLVTQDVRAPLSARTISLNSQTLTTINPHVSSFAVNTHQNTGVTGLAYDRETREFLTVTTRGPTAVTGCADGTPSLKVAGFTPAVTTFTLATNKYTTTHSATFGTWQGLFTSLGYTTGDATKVTDPQDTTTGGTCNPITQGAVKRTGLDLSAVQFLEKDLFIGSDNLGPKVVIFRRNGEIVATYVPQNVTEVNGATSVDPYNVYTATNLGSPIHEVLPAVFAARASSRGLSVLAVSPNKRYAVTCLRGAADGHGVHGAYADVNLREGRAVRCVKLDISNIQAPRVAAEKIVLQSDRTVYPGNTQSQVSFVAATWVGGEKVALVEEGAVNGARPARRLIEADFATGTNIAEVAKFNSVVLDGTKVTGLEELEGKALTGDAVSRLRLLVPAVHVVETRILIDWTAPNALVSGADPTSVTGLVIIDQYNFVLLKGTWGTTGSVASTVSHYRTHNKLSDSFDAQVTDIPTANEYAYPQNPSKTGVRVQSFEFPKQQLIGEVNRQLSNADGFQVTCNLCGKSCALRLFDKAINTGARAVCADAPGVSAIAYDHCKNEFVVATDAGPQQWCGNTRVATPLAKFTPAFASLKLRTSARQSTLTSVDLNKWDSIKGEETYVSGTPNTAVSLGGATLGAGVTNTVTGTCNALAGLSSTLRPSGLDVSDIKLVGTDLVVGTSRYGPKIVVFSRTTGRIAATYVAVGQNGTTYKAADVDSKVFGVLPPIFGAYDTTTSSATFRREAGLSGLAVSRDGTKLTVCMGRALTGAGLGATTTTQSRVIRCAMLSIGQTWAEVSTTAPVLLSQKVFELPSANGALSVVAADWQHGNTVTLFIAPNTAPARTCTVEPHACTYVAAGSLYSVDFGNGTNIKDNMYLNDVNQVIANDIYAPGQLRGLKLERQVSLATTAATRAAAFKAAGVEPMPLKMVFDFSVLGSPAFDTAQIGGFSYINEQTVAFVENGRYQRFSKVHVLHLTSTVAGVQEPSCLTPAPTSDTITHLKNINYEALKRIQSEREGAATYAVSIATLLACMVATLML